ncbi:hypothetical protein PRZ48_011860 [Zasmidium cellare]|uniref:Uncharacterized protein n=1 Tax=Zasmidium cellare TaxID=395010 RepID=A0ABR0E7M1_ZASCE|nr:hypothetical protein PRZ48_011860 [Zasmidium cellare]
MSQDQSSRSPNTVSPPQQLYRQTNAIPLTDAAKALVQSYISPSLTASPVLDAKTELRAVTFIAALNTPGYNTIHHSLPRFFLRAIGDLAKADRPDLVSNLSLFMPVDWRTHFMTLQDRTHAYVVQDPGYKWSIYGKFPKHQQDAEWTDWIREDLLE